MQICWNEAFKQFLNENLPLLETFFSNIGIYAKPNILFLLTFYHYNTKLKL